MTITYTQDFIYNGFRINNIQPIEEVSCTLVELEHLQTGAQIIHIQNDDPENVFCISMRTLPTTSNGIAHILEHTVLCGSEKYPIRDPFFSMSRRSLHTFMNALTGQDFTCYPAATQIEKDFYNLLDVYLDAIFHPLLTELSFAQEGCRLEFEKTDDMTTPLQFKGVVFNEMKGALGSSSTRLFEAIIRYLYPDSPYGCNSGGEPLEIPKLTHQELRDFHKTYYHPSRSLFFFYGNIALEKHLDFLEEKLLKDVKKVPALPSIQFQPRMTQPVKKTLYYPIAADEIADKKTLVGFGFLTTSNLDNITMLGLTILDSILMDTDASLLRHALLQSGLCSQVHSYLGTESLEAPYIITVKGVQEGSEDQIEMLLRETCAHIITQDIPEKLIDSAIHQLEIAKLEIGSHSGYPFGLSLFVRCGLLKQHGGKTEDGIRIYSLFQEIRDVIAANPRYLQELLATYVLQNSHCVRITMRPSTELMQQEAAEEQAMLQKIQQKLSEQEKQHIVNQAIALKKSQEQDSKTHLELLPKISIKDVPQETDDFSLITSRERPVSLFHHATFTNHITYVDLVFPLPHLSASDLWILRLLTQLITQLGSGNRNYQQNLEFIQEHTGGISAGLVLYHQVERPDHFTPCLYIKGKSLSRKNEQLIRLLTDIVTQYDFSDTYRIRECITRMWTQLSNAIQQNALSYAITLSGSSLSPANTLLQNCYGTNYFSNIRSLAHHYDTREEQLLADFTRLAQSVFQHQGAECILTCDSNDFSSLEERGFYGLLDLPYQPKTPWKQNIEVSPVSSQAISLASPVASTAKTFATVAYNHVDAPAIAIAANLFENITIHTRVREQGGAYGAGTSYSAMTGTFHFYSYSDPHIASTLKAFEESIEEIASGNFSDEDLEEAKLGIIQALDAPIAPSKRAEAAYGWRKEGKDLMKRLHFKKQICDMDRERIVQAVIQHIKQQHEQSCIVSFAHKDLIAQENTKLSTPLHINTL